MSVAKLLREGRCRTCGRERYGTEDWGFATHPLTRHHLVPKRQGGTNAEDNLIPVCFRCHKIIDGQQGQAEAERLRRVVRATLRPEEASYCDTRMGRGWLDRNYPLAEATGRDAPRPVSLIGPAAEPLQTDKEKDRSACSQP